MANSIDFDYVEKVYKMTKNYSEIQDNYLSNYSEYLPSYADPKIQSGIKSIDDKKHIVSGNTFNEVKLSDNRINNANELSTSPSLMDGYQSDINELLMQQNTVYIISSIVVSSLLVLAILVGKS